MQTMLLLMPIYIGTMHSAGVLLKAARIGVVRYYVTSSTGLFIPVRFTTNSKQYPLSSLYKETSILL